jgi:hypothetical protein
MSLANPRWGAPRIDGELLKLGIDIGETTVAKYMVRRSSSQTWKTFLKNHMHDLVSADLFVVPTATFRFALCLSRALARSAAESYILLSLPIPLLNGLHSSFGTPFPGTRYLDFYCTTATHATEKSSIRQHVPWAKAPRSPRWVSFDTVTRSNCANIFCPARFPGKNRRRHTIVPSRSLASAMSSLRCVAGWGEADGGVRRTAPQR